MRTLTMLGVLGTLVLGGATTAAAQDSPDQEVTEFTFTDELVRGDLVRPDGQALHARRRGARETLIQVRSHFVPELYKSVEQL